MDVFKLIPWRLTNWNLLDGVKDKEYVLSYLSYAIAALEAYSKIIK